MLTMSFRPPPPLPSRARPQYASAAAGADESGFSVSGGFDMNGDGLSDFIIGAPEGGTIGEFDGEAYVVFGQVWETVCFGLLARAYHVLGSRVSQLFSRLGPRAQEDFNNCWRAYTRSRFRVVGCLSCTRRPRYSLSTRRKHVCGGRSPKVQPKPNHCCANGNTHSGPDLEGDVWCIGRCTFDR